MFSFPLLAAKMELDSRKYFSNLTVNIWFWPLKYSSVKQVALHTEPQFILYFLSHILSRCGSFTEAVRLSDPRMHQALHRPQLVTKARQSSFSQRPSGEGGQGTSSNYIFLQRGHFAESRI